MWTGSRSLGTSGRPPVSPPACRRMRERARGPEPCVLVASAPAESARRAQPAERPSGSDRAASCRVDPDRRSELRDRHSCPVPRRRSRRTSRYDKHDRRLAIEGRLGRSCPSDTSTTISYDSPTTSRSEAIRAETSTRSSGTAAVANTINPISTCVMDNLQPRKNTTLGTTCTAESGYLPLRSTAESDTANGDTI